jgi:hypothetical protein
MSSFNGEDQFICPAGRPALPCPALRAGQGEIFFISHHQGRAGQGHSRAQDRAGQKKLPCDGLCLTMILKLIEIFFTEKFEQSLSANNRRSEKSEKNSVKICSASTFWRLIRLFTFCYGE